MTRHMTPASMIEQLRKTELPSNLNDYVAAYASAMLVVTILVDKLKIARDGIQKAQATFDDIGAETLAADMQAALVA